MKTLIINLGATSSKVAVYEGETELLTKIISHDVSVMSQIKTHDDQLAFRKDIILNEIKNAGYELGMIEAVCSRGGPLKPVESGTYLINPEVVKDAANPLVGGRHASGLGVEIAWQLATEYHIPAYFADPVSTDELIDEARLTGLKGMYRDSMFHALNQKSAARKTAELLGKRYDEVNLIGVHMGGGVSVAAHCHGKVIDNYNTIIEGCFSMDRPGSLPTTDVIELCFSGMSKQEIRRLIHTQAGVYSHLGTKDFREVETRVEAGDEEAEKVFNAMVYQHTKCIGAMASALKYEIDAVFLTGGIAHSKMMCDGIKSYISKLAPVIELPGENEMKSLADCVVRVLRGEPLKTYGKAI